MKKYLQYGGHPLMTSSRDVTASPLYLTVHTQIYILEEMAFRVSHHLPPLSSFVDWLIISNEV
jgi:hypothetical protein